MQLAGFAVGAFASKEWGQGAAHALAMVVNLMLALALLFTPAELSRWWQLLSLAACALVMTWDMATDFGGVIGSLLDRYIMCLVRCARPARPVQAVLHRCPPPALPRHCCHPSLGGSAEGPFWRSRDARLSRASD